MQWAVITSFGTNAPPLSPSNNGQPSQPQLGNGPSFFLEPISSCQMLSAGPVLNTTGFLSFSVEEDGFGVCSFNVTLCDSATCSSAQRLVIEVAAGEQ
jgi:hypothetical protein